MFVLVAMFSSILAVSAPGASAEPGDPNSISGTVTKPSGDGARGIHVTGTLSGGGDSFAVVTDTNGMYSAVGLTAGSWQVRFEDLDNRTLATEYFPGVAPPSTAFPVTVSATPAVADASLVAGAAINGTVFDNTGRTVPAIISVFADAAATMLVETQTAGSDGTYRLRGLQPGTYYVRAVDAVFGVTQWLGGGAAPGTPVVVAAGQILGGRNFTLPGGRITGTVTTTGATPAAGVEVQFDGVGTVYSATNGTYVSPFLAVDTYTVTYGGTLDTDAAVGVVDGATVPNTNGAIGAGAPAVTGTVTAGGAALPGVTVRVTGAGAGAIVETGASGTYTAYIPAGAVTVDFISPNYVSAFGVPATSPGVVNRVLAGSTALLGPPPGTTVSTGGVAINGLPRISGFSGPTITHSNCVGGFGEISLSDGLKTWAQQMDEIGAATGNYVAKIPLVTTLGLYGATTVTITIDCAGTPSVTTFGIYIDPSGRVYDTSGNPVAGATVTLSRDDPSTGVADFTAVPAGSAVMDPKISTANPLLTDSAGFYRWDLAPGTYKVTVAKTGCYAVGDPGTLAVTSSAFTAATLNVRVTMQCAFVAPPTDPSENPEIAPGGECPSPGALDPFTDVAATSFARVDITCIFQLHVTTGTSATTYSPKDNVTREQMASFLARLYAALTGGLAPVVSTPFTDIATASAFAREDIARIYGLGITTGTSATTYSPKDFVTREQMASFLARLFTSVTAASAPAVTTPFADLATAAAFAQKDIARIYGLGITTGTSATTYSPKDNVTREQMASFLARLFRVAGGSEA